MHYFCRIHILHFILSSCYILWIMAIGILLCDTVDLEPWTSLCYKILWFLALQSLFCSEILGILDPNVCFIVGYWRS